MKDIKDDSIATAFFDLQYRDILDKMHYGNKEKKRGIARAGLQQMDELTIVRFIKEIDATTKDWKTVLDPAAGGYSVFKACQELKIDFIGGDISFGEK